MQRLKGDVRQPWADGPRTQQCDGLAFSQVTGRGGAGSLQAVNPARAECRRQGCVRGLVLEAGARVQARVSGPLRAVLRPTFRTPSQALRKKG